LLIVVGFFAAVLSLKTDVPNDFVAQKIPGGEGSIVSISKPDTIIVQTSVGNDKPETILPTNSRKDKSEYRAVKVDFIKREVKPNIKTNANTRIKTPDIINNSESRTTNENVLGEESYVKTIATLTETVKNRKDEVLNSSSRFAFERDLAVTNDAIEKMRAEVKENPKNEAAKQILRASYQNKIDLLNSVAEKTELMATLK